MQVELFWKELANCQISRGSKRSTLYFCVDGMSTIDTSERRTRSRGRTRIYFREATKLRYHHDRNLIVATDHQSIKVTPTDSK